MRENNYPVDLEREGETTLGREPWWRPLPTPVRSTKFVDHGTVTLSGNKIDLFQYEFILSFQSDEKFCNRLFSTVRSNKLVLHLYYCHHLSFEIGKKNGMTVSAGSQDEVVVKRVNTCSVVNADVRMWLRLSQQSRAVPCKSGHQATGHRFFVDLASSSDPSSAQSLWI